MPDSTPGLAETSAYFEAHPECWPLFIEMIDISYETGSREALSYHLTVSTEELSGGIPYAFHRFSERLGKVDLKKKEIRDPIAWTLIFMVHSSTAHKKAMMSMLSDRLGDPALMEQYWEPFTGLVEIHGQDDPELTPASRELSQRLITEGKTLDCSRLFGNLGPRIIQMHRKSNPPTDFEQYMRQQTDKAISQGIREAIEGLMAEGL